MYVYVYVYVCMYGRQHKVNIARVSTHIFSNTNVAVTGTHDRSLTFSLTHARTHARTLSGGLCSVEKSIR